MRILPESAGLVARRRGAALGKLTWSGQDAGLLRSSRVRGSRRDLLKRVPVPTIERVQDATTYFLSIGDDLCELVVTRDPVDRERILVFDGIL
jgi:hypothetical protein